MPIGHQKLLDLPNTIVAPKRSPALFGLGECPFRVKRSPPQPKREKYPFSNPKGIKNLVQKPNTKGPKSLELQFGLNPQEI